VIAIEQPPSALDRQFAELIGRLAEKPLPELRLAALLVSRHRTGGNICLPLREIGGQALPETIAGFERAPKASTWVKKLRSTNLVGAPGDFKPLILDECDRLYLCRYWQYEHSLAETIKAGVNGPRPSIDLELLRNGLDRLFPSSRETNWQKVAAFNAVVSNFCVITGGPGTGKTRTVVAILVLLLEQAGGKKLRVALAAPSGKAAARLKESIQLARETLHCADEIKALLPTDATTIHRLLGTIPDSPYFRHNADRPLLVDLVILDEASMVDLATMSKLFAAIPAGARVVLLGDKDQLTSVEAGYVLGDICNTGSTIQLSDRFAHLYDKVTGEKLSTPAATTRNAMQDCIVELRKNYRFRSDSGIYRLSDAINKGDTEGAFEVLRAGTYRDVTWRSLPGVRALPRLLLASITDGYQSYLAQDDPAQALERLSDFRVLCAVRNGPYGVAELNRLSEQILSQAGLLQKADQWYRGRPVMVTRNDYNLKLFNGDIGLVLPDPEAQNEMRVFFSSADGKMRRLIPSRLPVHETAYALTVHKSQGSEFGRVLLILPQNDSSILTRELLYTGLTRAREHVEIWSSEGVLRSAIARRVARTSGLRDALWT
jgi:exodeoxyribonuclease V alpha subunit